VFVAFQRTLKRQIAVKILPKSLITPAAAERFQQEAEAAAILSHPNIIPVYEVGETEAFLFFTMQLVNGQPLSALLIKMKKNILPSKRVLPAATTFDLVIQVLDALDYAHREGLVHQDVKPANILLEAHTGRPILMDFGIVKIIHDKEEKTARVHGTPLYMAPEQVLGLAVDGRADMYAVGVMLFQMLVPELPLPQFASKSAMLKKKVLSKDGIFLKTPSQLNTHHTAAIDRIIERATAFDPAQRYATCREFIDDLERYRNSRLA
jgi:serine/threonine protein kinase